MGGFDEFFSDHYDDVVRSLSLAIGDRQRAEDAAQEAFAKAYRRWPSVAAMDRPVGWVLVVATNQVRRWIARAERQAQQDPAPVADHAGVVADDLTLRDALDRLPPRQRATVVLRYLCDLPTSDVARALGCSEGTVKSALHIALRNLRIELDDDDGDGENEEVSHAHR
jgi:RNA polymerase sigma-70 factor (sigma-E family)